MATQLNQLVPKVLWKNFESICKIPRPSKKEGKIIDFIVDFAESHKFAYKKDVIGNIVIRKPPTKGHEHKPGIVLQAHLDMVPQKNANVRHDFDHDPILPVIDGEWVHATGTTLGADNGIGVAAGLAVLESTDIEHGPVEVLFTIDEETGMTGAINLSKDFVKGRILLNLDSEDDGELFIGCAGGINTSVSFSYTSEPVTDGTVGFKISLTGLKGGHSGVDIHLGRGNANKLINRILWKSSRELGLRIASLEGGSVRNAIPREAFANVVVPVENKPSFLKLIDEFQEIFGNELSSIDPNVKLKVEETEKPAHLINKNMQDRFLNAIYAFPNGVMRMIADIPEVVETSSNLSIINTGNESIEILCLTRSSVDSAKIDLCNSITSVFELAGASVVHEGSYPGWNPNIHSKILETMKKIYLDKFGQNPEIKVIHAGLECGIIGDVYPGMDMISFGPTIRHAHSPDEKVNIATVDKFWDYLTETLKVL